MRKLKNRDRSVMCICVGENFKDNAPIGDCGDVKSLMEWLKYLSHRDEDEIEVFFDGSYTNKDAIDYVYRTWGKRLQAL